MRVLRLGYKGEDVKRWQEFLIGQVGDFKPFPNDHFIVNGEFNSQTVRMTVQFQKRESLTADGVVGPSTIGRAISLGFGIIDDSDDNSELGLAWPPPPDFSPVIGLKQRQDLFGAFEYVATPVVSNPEAIKILGSWIADNIESVEIPQLSKLPFWKGPNVIQFHKKAAPQLKQLWADWESDELLSCIISWGGSFAPRFIRGSNTVLSNHAFGSAFDINAQWNPLGARPALVGSPGCVRQLVANANANGFYWGGHFGYGKSPGRTDGMHFEIAKIL